MSEIEGVTQQKLNRLWKHLLKVEKLTGGKLKGMPGNVCRACPIVNFAPYEDCKGLRLWGGGRETGRVRYGWLDNKEYYRIYEPSDSHWWSSLPDETRRQITKWVIARIKERNE